MDKEKKQGNIIIESIGNNSSIVKMLITPSSLNPYGIVHGGLIFNIGDTVMGTTVRSTGRDAVTLDATINYLKPGTGKYLKAISEVIKIGKKTSILKANIYNDTQELIAIMTATYFFIWVNVWK